MDKTRKINKLLLPLSWIYGSGVWLRNKLFDWKILKSREFKLPVICIGNISVGGTGKTPHTEYLVSLLKDRYNVAVLSRGYKRKTKGFLLANENSNAREIGDEPKQIKDKFKNITVAVDEDRCHGIDKLLETGEKRPDIILLDDAFQHRYVKPGLSILLTSYDKIITEDCLLPAGRLREQVSGIERADIIIVTKCPDDMSPIDFRIKHNELNPYPYQKLFFTTFKYGNLVNIVNSDCRKKLCEITRKDSIVLLTGIANPKPMIDRLSCHSDNIVLMDFPDHHNFSSDDLKRIIKTFEKCESEKKYIITTEKDAARLKLHIKAFENIADSIFILPIEVEFLLNQGNMFNKIIEDYVRKNSRDGSVH